MKTKRFVSTLLALLLVCSLPVSAFADTVADNPAGTTVPEVSTGDTMGTNSGTVITNGGTVTTNNGTVEDNSGTVEANNNYIDFNNGTLKTNNGTVIHNYGTVTHNNGTVEINCGGTVETNYGTVVTNDGGTVETNYGTVGTNNGTVEINNTTGTVSNMRGTVTTNYGTVNKLKYDGGWVIGETWYGVQVDNDGIEIGEQYCKPDAVLDFSQLTKEGYEYAGYTQEYQLLDGVLTKQAITVSDTSYTVTCPNVLTLIWQAIYNPTADDGAGSFDPGSFVSINGHKFLLMAVVEDVYCLASVDSFGEEQLSDLPALLATLLTEEQLTHVTGEPELLDEELTARFFAGEGSHIVFPCDSSLIFS